MARTLRVVAVVLPSLAGALMCWAVAAALPGPSGVAGWIGWLVVLLGLTIAAVMVVQRLARKLLPLSWLLTLTLVFPDEAPSRLKAARRAASRRGIRKAGADAREAAIRQQHSHRLGVPGVTAGDVAESALVLVAALGVHDRRTQGHSERVRILADVLAEEAGVPEDDRVRLRWAALLHDIGKLTVPPSILNKPDRPDDAEWAALRRHPEEGKRLVEPLVEWLGPWGSAVAHHHERWDGAGYPEGLAAEEISLGGRVLAIADAYEVITAARAYKKPASPVAARQELVASAGTHFDPELVRHFLNIGLPRLWWIAGWSAALAQVPLLGRLWITPAGAQTRQAGSGPAVAAGALAVVAMAGGLQTGNSSPAQPLASGRSPAGAPAAPASETAPSPAAEPDPAVTAELGVSPPSTTVTPAPAQPTTRMPVATTAPPRRPAPVSFEPLGPAAAPPPPGADPTPPPTPPAVRPDSPATLYAGRGTILAPGLLRELGLGLTETELRLLCSPNPITQGIDALVLELPPIAQVAGAIARTNSQEVEVAFYSSSCAPLARAPGPAAAVGTPVPAGARFAVLVNRASANSEVGLVITDQ